MGHTLDTVADSWMRSPGGSSISTEFRVPPRLGVWPLLGIPVSAMARSAPRASDGITRTLMGTPPERNWRDDAAAILARNFPAGPRSNADRCPRWGQEGPHEHRQTGLSRCQRYRRAFRLRSRARL